MDLAGHIGQVLSVALTNKVVQLYRSGVYPSGDRGIRQLHAIGADFGGGDIPSYGGIFHVDGNHWVFATMTQKPFPYAEGLSEPAASQERKGTIRYGDSLAADAGPGETCVTPDTVDALEWFQRNHNPSFVAEVLLTSVLRQADGWSCGILSFFGLAHEFLPDIYPLPGSDSNSCDLLRVHVFTRIIELHHHRLASGSIGPLTLMRDMVPFTTRIHAEQRRSRNPPPYVQPSAPPAMLVPKRPRPENAVPSPFDLIRGSQVALKQARLDLQHSASTKRKTTVSRYASATCA